MVNCLGCQSACQCAALLQHTVQCTLCKLLVFQQSHLDLLIGLLLLDYLIHGSWLKLCFCSLLCDFLSQCKDIKYYQTTQSRLPQSQRCKASRFCMVLPSTWLYQNCKTKIIAHTKLNLSTGLKSEWGQLKILLTPFNVTQHAQHKAVNSVMILHQELKFAPGFMGGIRNSRRKLWKYILLSNVDKTHSPFRDRLVGAREILQDGKIYCKHVIPNPWFGVKIRKLLMHTTNDIQISLLKLLLSDLNQSPRVEKLHSTAFGVMRAGEAVITDKYKENCNIFFSNLWWCLVEIVATFLKNCGTKLWLRSKFHPSLQ
jgi:hypothetical protein